MKLKYRFLKIGICLTLLIVMLSFSIKRFENSKFGKLKVKIHEPELGFVDSKSIASDFYTIYKDTSAILIKDVDVKEIENTLRKNPYTDSVNVYLDQSGNLNFYIDQKRPVLRINNGKSTHYISDRGEEVPISHRFSLPVLMVEGDIVPQEIPQLLQLEKLISEDKLLTKHIVGVKKLQDKSFILLVNVDDFVLEIGSLDDLEEKLKNLKAFYAQYLNQVGLEKYKKISLKYKNQIVATKK